MKAVVQKRYGPPEAVLELCEAEKPTATDDEVLIRVRAASVHPDVWHVVTGRPYLLRLMSATLFKPKDPIPGTDAAGVVEAVGENVTRFKPGDAVFGETHLKLQWRNGGAFAEYVSVPEEALALKPDGVTFEQAAAVPTSGYIAALNLESGALVQPGHHVLVNGAAGGVGAIALQLAKAYGAEVTAVDSTEKLALLHQLGADHVIDYTLEDFTQDKQRYDLIFDVASNLSLRTCKGVLKPSGQYVLIGHDHYGQARGRVFGSLPRFFLLMAMSLFSKHLPKLTAKMPKKSEVMAALRGLLQSGKLTPTIDSTYPLNEVHAAMRRLQSGHALGKVIITP